MEEHWLKDLGDTKREYIIDRIRSRAAVRSMDKDGRVFAAGDMTKSLLNGELTPDKLRERGYKLKGGKTDG